MGLEKRELKKHRDDQVGKVEGEISGRSFIMDDFLQGRRSTINGIPTTLLTDKQDWELCQWLPRGLKAEEMVIFPDACPGKAPLPTGTALRTFDPNWRKYAVSDCGCGMQLLQTGMSSDEFQKRYSDWDTLGTKIRQNKGGLGDLGGGNHFIDALKSCATDEVYFLIHTGSRNESGLVDHLIDRPKEFDKEFERIVTWARNNRDAVATTARAVFGKSTECIWDKPHNTFEQLSDGSVILRKGVMSVKQGEEFVIPSSMTGEVILGVATAGVDRVLNSMSHGTGRVLSRADAKDLLATDTTIRSPRELIYIPEYISDSSLRTEGPHCYRDLDQCLNLLGPTIDQKERFSVLAYLGHL